MTDVSSLRGFWRSSLGRVVLASRAELDRKKRGRRCSRDLGVFGHDGREEL